MRRTSSELATRRNKIDELDIHLLTTLEERQDRLYAILSKTTRYRNILGDEIKRLRAGSAPEMIRPLVAQWDHLRREIKRLGRYEGLIIDDLGYLQQSRDDMEVVFTLLAERYERGSVLMTSNLPFSKWEAIFKDAMMTAAAIDRLVHHSVIIELNITSYRVEEAKKNQLAESQAEGE